MRGALQLAILGLVVAGCSASSDVSRQVGARCDQSDQCDDRCLADPAFPGGFCTLTCDDDRGCPSGSRCAAEQGGVCLFACQTQPNCGFLGPGWRCEQQDGKPGGQVSVCVGGAP